MLSATSGLDGYDSRPTLDDDGWDLLLGNLDRISDRAAEHGVRAVLHPHVGTMVENGDEVQRVLGGSSISLCLDTGHLLIGGTDPADLTRQAPDRIAHTHLKDVDSQIADKVRAGRLSYTEAVVEGMYRPLGTGDVDVAAIVNTLQGNGYAGWYTLEQDTILTEEPRGEGPVHRRADQCRLRPQPAHRDDHGELTGPVEPLRIGVLGAARISELSIVGPAAATGTRLVAVAARDRDRAEAFAGTHGIERVHESYADVIADPEVEAIYNPLANSLHAPWNKAAILAGKHVLTEKPFASNAPRPPRCRDLARGRSLVLFEGFHYLYHPLMKRLMSLLADGELGTLQRVESTMFMSAPAADDPRWSLDLAGGALMDLGCYALARPTRPR